jgi:hypothetical protein
MYNTTITNGEVEDWWLLRILASPENILTGSRQASGNLLKWTNTTGLQAIHYTIERSLDNLSWDSLGTVYSQPGNSTFLYSYTDENPGMENYYRLKISLEGGAYQYSNILPLFDKGKGLPVIVYPNPAVNSLHVQTCNSNYNKLKIVDLTGQMKITQEINAGKTTVDISQLVPGTYIIKFSSKTGGEDVQRFVKIK